MKKPATFLFGLIAAAIGWVIFQNFDIKGLEDFKVVPRNPQEQASGDGGALPGLPPAQ